MRKMFSGCVSEADLQWEPVWSGRVYNVLYVVVVHRGSRWAPPPPPEWTCAVTGAPLWSPWKPPPLPPTTAVTVLDLMVLGPRYDLDLLIHKMSQDHTRLIPPTQRHLIRMFFFSFYRRGRWDRREARLRLRKCLTFYLWRRKRMRAAALRKTWTTTWRTWFVTAGHITAF